MSQHIIAKNCRIVAVDNSNAMLARFEHLLELQKPPPLSIDLKCANIQDIVIENASVVVLNFTLQFLPLADRAQLLEKIYHGLLPNDYF